MRQITPEFQQHLDGECLTICNCWRLARQDGQVLGFTDHDRDISFDGQDYEAASGMEPSQIESQNGLAPDNHEIMGALQSNRITEEDILARLYDNARIDHYVVNWSAPSQRVLLHRYLLSEIARSDGEFKAELKSLTAILDQTNMRRFERRCSADFGDARCGVDVNGSYTVSAEVDGYLARDKILVSGLQAYPDNWFAGGRLTFTSGANQGKSFEIVDQLAEPGSQTVSILTLWEAPPHPIESGMTFTLQPGCDKLFSTCRQKYSNGENFRGFPHMPGTDFAASYANNSDKMDGGPLFP